MVYTTFLLFIAVCTFALKTNFLNEIKSAIKYRCVLKSLEKELDFSIKMIKIGVIGIHIADSDNDCEAKERLLDGIYDKVKKISEIYNLIMNDGEFKYKFIYHRNRIKCERKAKLLAEVTPKR